MQLFHSNKSPEQKIIEKGRKKVDKVAMEVSDNEQDRPVMVEDALYDQALQEDRLRELLPTEIRAQIKEVLESKLRRVGTYRLDLNNNYFMPIIPASGTDYAEVHMLDEYFSGFIPNEICKGDSAIEIADAKEIFASNLAESIANFGSTEVLVENIFSELLERVKMGAEKGAKMFPKHRDEFENTRIEFEKHKPEITEMIKRTIVSELERVLTDEKRNLASAEASEAIPSELAAYVDMLGVAFKELSATRDRATLLEVRKRLNKLTRITSGIVTDTAIVTAIVATAPVSIPLIFAVKKTLEMVIDAFFRAFTGKLR